MQMAHPGLPEFDYIRPGSLTEASQFLADHAEDARLFTGGTDTFVRMRDGVWKARYLVDIKGLPETNVLHYSPAEGLMIGAAVNMNQISGNADILECYPLLAEAARSVASYQLRSRATMVGNICNASPAGDTIGACLVLGGMLQVFGPKGYRMEPLATFFKGPGRTVLQAGDIVTYIRFPNPPPGAVGTYRKLGRNAAGDLSIVGVTVLGYPDGGTKSGYRFKIALASVAPVPLMVGEAEKILARGPEGEKTIEEAATAAMEACKPIDDVRGGARYRKYMVRNLTRLALVDTWQKLRLGA